MTVRTTLLIAATIALGLVWWFGSGDAAGAQTVQTELVPEQVHTIQLSGADAALRLHTQQTGRELRVDVSANIWCGLRARIQTNGDALVITIERRGQWSRWWCDPSVDISMPSGIALDIALRRLAANITGRYGDVHISSVKSVVNFNGSASHFDMTGAAAVVNLGFPPDMPRDAIDLNVGQLISRVTFTGS